MSNKNVNKDFKKILVVDDILYVTKSISRTLKNEGYFVITALSADEAIQKIKKYSPDLITVDQKLTDMTGINLVKKLKSELEYSPRIIFITAIYDKIIVQDALKLGVDHYLIKPFKKNKLLETIEKLLSI